MGVPLFQVGQEQQEAVQAQPLPRSPPPPAASQPASLGQAPSLYKVTENELVVHELLLQGAQTPALPQASLHGVCTASY